MVLIIFTENASNLTKSYWDMVLDGQKVWMDGPTDTPTHRQRQNYIPPTLLGDNKYEVIIKLLYRCLVGWNLPANS